MAFKSADRFGYTITLPYDDDRSYTIQSPSYDVGIRITEMSTAVARAHTLTEAGKDIPDDLLARVQMDDAAEIDWYADVLGADVLQQMRDDRLPFEFIKMCAATVTVWVLNSREDAEAFFNAGGRPRPTRTPQDRKKKTSRPT